MGQQTLGRQRGLSLIGFIIIAALVLAVAFVAFQAFPAYQEYFTIRKVLASTMNQIVEGTSPVEIRRQFDLVASADYIDSVKGRDIEITREGGKMVASVAWSRKIHIAGNAYLLLEFDTSASK
jgi:hypothetical protein